MTTQTQTLTEEERLIGIVTRKPSYHFRVSKDGKQQQRGGVTVSAFRREDEGISIGIAVCCRQDHYDRKQGRRISLRRIEKMIAVGDWRSSVVNYSKEDISTLAELREKVTEFAKHVFNHTIGGRWAKKYDFELLPEKREATKGKWIKKVSYVFVEPKSPTKNKKGGEDEKSGE